MIALLHVLPSQAVSSSWYQRELKTVSIPVPIVKGTLSVPPPKVIAIAARESIATTLL